MDSIVAAFGMKTLNPCFFQAYPISILTNSIDAGFTLQVLANCPHMYALATIPSLERLSEILPDFL